MHFGVNTGQVMSETIDGETIIIHLGTGSYYSLQQAGADIWSAVTRAADEAQIIEEIVGRYDVERAEAEASVTALLSELQAESLVVRSESGATYQAADTPGEPRRSRRRSSRSTRTCRTSSCSTRCTRSMTAGGRTPPRLRSAEPSGRAD